MINSKKPTVAYRCKNIFTGVNETLIDGYLVIDGNKIADVGSLNDLKTDLNNCEIVDDYKENFIMPGFFDLHVHLISAAMLERDGILRYAASEEEAAEYLYDLHKNRKNIKWILGGAWDPILWPNQQMPTKESLDKYFKDVPVFLLNKEVHGAWANSCLLDMFNITKDTPDPENGAFYRDENGEPTGYIHEAACAPILEEIYSRITDEEMVEYVDNFIKVLNRKGITSVGDVFGSAPIREGAYRLMEESGKLNCRIRFYKSIYEGVDKTLENMKNYNSEFLSCGGVKTFIDGTPQGYTGYMLEDYSDRPGERSEALFEPEVIKRMVKEYDENGISVRIHACGDAGVRLCLDAFEYAFKENGGLHARHCIEHLEATHPDDLARFGKLGVVASVQPEHMPKYDFYKHPFHEILGAERMKYSYPFETIRKNGAVLAFGTDCPVADITPYRGIFRASTRLTNDGEPKGGWNPDERVSVFESMKAYTWGSAYGADKETQVGSLEAGKLADFIVLEENLFECADDIDKIFDMETMLTVVDGKVVWRKEKI